MDVLARLVLHEDLRGAGNVRKFHCIIIHSLGFSNEIFTDLMHKFDTHNHWIGKNARL
jgi:hypothetical protein